MTTAIYKFEDTSRSSIEKLKALIEADKEGGAQSDFGWLEDILDKTLEQYTIADFNTTPANIDAYNPLQVEMHLAEGSRLLDLCLNQRKEIYQLESQAILSALDICLSRQTLDFDEKLARINLAASIKQAQLSPNNGSADLRDRYQVLRFSLTERLKLHNRIGSALNYGERVRFMRKIYVDNLRLAYQRLNAAWRGMAFAYRIKTSEPIYIPTDNSILDSYIKWMRAAITAIEEGDAHERVYDFRVRLIRDGLDKKLRENRDGSSMYMYSHVGEFTLKKEHFEKYKSAWPAVPVANIGLLDRLTETDAVRLLGLDVSFIFPIERAWAAAAKDLKDKIQANDQARDMASYHAFFDDNLRQFREHLSLEVALTPPMAITEFESIGKEYRWQPADLWISDAPAWTEGTSRDHVKFTIDPNFQNFSPFGLWKYSSFLKSHYNKGTTLFEGDDAISWLFRHFSDGTAFLPRLAPHDILVVLKVAVRPSKHKKP